MALQPRDRATRSPLDGRGHAPRLVERASPTDLAFLAMDRGQVPEQFAVVLRLAGNLDLGSVRSLLAARVHSLPRLRQRLIRAPLGCGPPVWVDDPDDDIARRVRAVPCRHPGDEQALLDTALPEILLPLPRTAPLWSAVLVTGLTDGGCALVLVLHHVLADGMGALAVLAALLDPGGGDTPPLSFPRPWPTRADLARDAWATRLKAPARVPRAWRSLLGSLSAGGGLRPPRAAPCSLQQRTGPRRRMAVVRAELAPLRTAAHRHGATTNDAVLVAVAGALNHVLRARGESIASITITVPVSGRPTSGAEQTGWAQLTEGVQPTAGAERTAGEERGHGGELGNLVSPLLVNVPTSGDLAERLAEVRATIRAGRRDATGPPPIAVLGWLFRPAARLGVYGCYMNHQHRFHTLVSHVRGPDRPVRFGALEVSSAVPVGVAEGGNTPVCFEVLSYGGALTIAAIVDPDHFAELDELTARLATELRLIAAS